RACPEAVCRSAQNRLANPRWLRLRTMHFAVPVRTNPEPITVRGLDPARRTEHARFSHAPPYSHSFQIQHASEASGHIEHRVPAEGLAVLAARLSRRRSNPVFPKADCPDSPYHA